MSTPRARLTFLAFLGTLAACGNLPQVKYVKDTGQDTGYRFVIPRTVVKIGTDVKKNTTETAYLVKLTATAIPVNYDESEKRLPVFRVMDDSGRGFRLSSTSITNVKYFDDLIVQSIGVEVTDNAKQAISALVSVAAIALPGAVGAAAVNPKLCSSEPDWSQLPAFSILSFDASSHVVTNPLDASECWAYSVSIQNGDTTSTYSYPKGDGNENDFPLDKAVKWFPYPYCQTATIKVYPCEAKKLESDLCKEDKTRPEWAAREISIAVARGDRFRRMPLPAKGAISMHPDLCVADATNAAGTTSSAWDLLGEAAKDLKAVKKK